jgi:hypothetical protein
MADFERLRPDMPIARYDDGSEMILIVDDDPKFLEEAQVALAPIRAHGILFAETESRAMDLILVG